MKRSNKGSIKVYHGFGHKQDMEVFGHVFRKRTSLRTKYSSNAFVNMMALLRLFFVKPLPKIPVQLTWHGQKVEGHTEYDGFFRLSWQSTDEVDAGWHDIEVNSDESNSIEPGVGKIFIPHITQFVFISDIDDTVLRSHSATIGKRLKELLFKNPADRFIFKDTALHYELLSEAHTTREAPNPFFYISSSEWNLYDYLNMVFKKNKLPEGAFLLNQVKRWYELWKTGKTRHEGKLLRILRVLKAFPNQRFVLFGDNSQSDPSIYATLTKDYSHRIFAVYIRNVSPANENATKAILKSIEEKSIHALLFKESEEAIQHSRAIGLISR
jgi:phosphatidate phosphatase APP1